MIMRMFLIFGLILLGGTGYFIVVQTPPTVQAAPAVGEIVRLREEGIFPEEIMFENEEIEHDTFGVPPEDEAMIAAAEANMDMGDMDMDMGNGAMDMAEDDAMDMAEDDAMDMAEDGAMDMAEDGAMDMAEDDAMDMDNGDGAMDMAESAMDEEEADRLMAGRMAGLLVTDEGEFDREVTLSMTEWSFSDLSLDAQPGEKIRFTVRNDGQIVHEFMFMGMAQMQGVNYRARRADWNLLEHEALFEKSLLLPGEEITFVAEVLNPGVWMFMCMVPYHMQMGMMGQLATEGMTMEM